MTAALRLLACICGLSAAQAHAQQTAAERVALREAREAALSQIDHTLDEGRLRVCADPNNLPFSNERGEGLENALAELVADALDAEVEYTWHAQRRGFLRQTLNAGLCDVVMGTPALDMLQTTRPYYRSGYVFVSRADRDIDVSSIDDPRLRDLTIGVHLVGDDGANTPPAHALGERGIIDNVVGYTVYGDYRQEAPPARLLDAVVAGEVDIAAVWGPLAGYYARTSEVPLDLAPITDTVDYLPLVFEYSIAIGVRRTDDELRHRLDAVLVEKQDEVEALLERYGVPEI
ncbi:substrate-binding domain-containing protein [Palleronia sp.]|uniref:substrate-binding domain-containing protein n=1 Tax=Palleronia sp. TaxID=1940284 RepID=UPI0035C87306